MSFISKYGIDSNNLMGILSYNDYKNITAAYSLRKMKLSATKAIRVRRGTDNTELDIGFVNNNLDTSSLINFIRKQGNLVNMFGTYGNFQTDVNSDGLGDGWTSIYLASKSMSNNEQTYIANAKYGGVGRYNIPATPTHIYYVSAYVKAASSSIYLSANDAPTYPTAYHSGSGNYEFLSLTFTKNSNDNNIEIVQTADGRSSSYTEIMIKQWHMFDLTLAFGAGNEPSKSEMDTYMQLQSYFTSQSATVGNAYVKTWYDQSGNANNATQTSTTYQPLIVFNGSLLTNSNGTPTINFNGIRNRLPISNVAMFRNVSDAFVNAVAKDTNPTSGNASHAIFVATINSGGFARVLLGSRIASLNAMGAGGRRLDADSFVSSTNGSNNSNLNIISGSFNYSGIGKVTSYVNGVANSSTSFTSGTGSTSDTASYEVCIGDYSTVNYFSGNISEIVVFNSLISDTARQNLERNQGLYYGVSVS